MLASGSTVYLASSSRRFHSATVQYADMIAVLGVCFSTFDSGRIVRNYLLFMILFRLGCALLLACPSGHVITFVSFIGIRRSVCRTFGNLSALHENFEI